MKRNMIVSTGTMIAFVMLGILGCKSDSSNPYSASTAPATAPPNTVVMSSSSFAPASMTVPRGTIVTWRNDDGVVHTSTSDGTGWDTGNIPAGTSKTTTFNTPGTFAYHCTYHQAMGMVGTITVQ